MLLMTMMKRRKKKSQALSLKFPSLRFRRQIETSLET
jgi:hypothetical protein